MNVTENRSRSRHNVEWFLEVYYTSAGQTVTLSIISTYFRYYEICNLKITSHCKIFIVPEEGWFGQPKPTKKFFYVVSTSASIFFILYVKPISSLLIQRTPAGSSFRLLAETFYSYTKIWFVNGVDNVSWPPYRDWKSYIAWVTHIWGNRKGQPDRSAMKGPHLERTASLMTVPPASGIAFSISVRWSIYIINSVDKPNFRVSLPHRRSTTVSSETNPLYSFVLLLQFGSCERKAKKSRLETLVTYYVMQYSKLHPQEIWIHWLWEKR